jgi:capsular exopolysaccharide synthesis family protein
MNSHHPFTALWVRRWTILGVSLMATLIAFIAAVSITPSYKATTTILVESHDENVVPIASIYSAAPAAQESAANPVGIDEYLETQFEILKSRPVIEKVINRLKLTENSDFNVEAQWHQWLSDLNGANSPSKNKFATAVNHYQDILTVEPIPKTQLVAVSISSPDAALAAAIANEHARAFIESYWDTEAAINNSVSTWMEQRAADLKKKLEDSESRLQAFKEKEKIMDIKMGDDSGIQAFPTQQLANMSTDLIEARRVLYEHTKIYEEVNAARDKPLNEKLAIPVVNADPLVMEFKQARSDAERDVAEAAKRYGPSHPAMASAVASRREAEHALANQVDSAMQSVISHQWELQGQVQALTASTNQTKADIQSVSDKESQYRALTQAVETDRDLYTMFDKRVNEAKIERNMTTANARVVEPARIPNDPDKPKIALILFGTFFLSAIACICSILFRNATRVTINASNDVEAETGLLPLGLIPRLERAGGFREYSRALTATTEKIFMESICATITSICLGQLNSHRKLVLVTSPCASEGKTLVACNIALELAKLERVLLIDGDLREPSVAKWFSIDGPGFVDVCSGNRQLNECIVRIDPYGLDVLPAGTRLDDPQPILSSARASDLFQILAEKYDRVIIDSPSALSTCDALLIAKHAQSVIFVIKAHSTTTSDLKKGLKRFENSPAHFDGIVLNQIDFKKFTDYNVTSYAA